MKYIVIRKCADLEGGQAEPGDVLDLSAGQAAARINLVEPAEKPKFKKKKKKDEED